ncbi:hypothetical protein AN641_01915 [Candidatus Epulonipiscioides gigas]|nr:hypothetical protein AN641_01915 [Epulopiscium sp. SCG-C07WGA-EpuloA2]
MTQKEQNRIYLLDNLKGLLIFLVVLGHSLELYIDDAFFIEIIYTFIYLFHMPVFVFISGYFSKNVGKCRQKAFRNFFVPYLIFNTIWALVSIPVVGIENISLLTPGWALWYLISMFFWRISLKDLIRVKYIFPISFIIGITTGLSAEFGTFLSLSRTLFFLPFFLGGYYLTENKLLSFRNEKKFFSIFMISLTVILAVVLSYTNIIPVQFLYGSQAYNNFELPLWALIIARIYMYIIGFSFVYILVNIVKPTKTFFSKVGTNTFSVYILHTYLVSLVYIVNNFIPFEFLKFLVCIITSIIITYILSLNKVMRIFTKLINNFIDIFTKKPKKRK